MKSRRKVWFRTIFHSWGALLVASLATAYAAGLITSEFQIFPHRQLVATFEFGKSLFNQSAEPEPTRVREPETGASVIQTNQVRLSLEPIARFRSRDGGGLTSFGDELVVLTGDGQILTASENSATPTEITSPDNGLEEYIAASETPEFRNLLHTPGRLRFHDIVYYQNDSEHGIAVSYTEWRDSDHCYGTTIAQLPLGREVASLTEVEATTDDWKIIFRSQPCLPLKEQFRAMEGHMAGGRIAFLPPTTILLASGDYHWDGVYGPAALSQQTDNDYGKVIAIDLETQAARHLSLGHRNTQGILLDSEGRIWVTEHGPRGGDELNLIEADNNYGWPATTLGTRYNTLPWPGVEDLGRHTGFASPIYAWVPSVGISNLTQVEGFHPAWDGNLLIASLAGQSLYRVWVENNRVVLSEPILVGHPIRYVHQHSDGRLVVLTGGEKELIYLHVAEQTATDVFVDDALKELSFDAEKTLAVATALETCQECHSLEIDQIMNAPSLGDVYGRPIASESFEYSSALSSRAGTWTTENLSEYILDPQSFAQGSTMPRTGTLDENTVGGIVQVLRMLSSDLE